MLSDWSSDGRWLAYRRQGTTTLLDIRLQPLDGDRKAVPISADIENPRQYSSPPLNMPRLGFPMNPSGLS